ncbi:MAG: metal-dependent hydrolase [Halobacteriales archaeon]
MRREGHIGAALLVYAPVGTALALTGAERFALIGAAAMVALSRVPDWDQRVPAVSHRGITHTFLFAAAMGGAGWLAGLYVAEVLAPGASPAVATYAAFLGTLSVVVHVAADALTSAGVRPFWPLWGRTISLQFTRPCNPVANYALLGLGVLATGVSLLVVTA